VGKVLNERRRRLLTIKPSSALFKCYSVLKEGKYLVSIYYRGQIVLPSNEISGSSKGITQKIKAKAKPNAAEAMTNEEVN